MPNLISAATCLLSLSDLLIKQPRGVVCSIISIIIGGVVGVTVAYASL